MKKKNLVFANLLLAFALILSACGGASAADYTKIPVELIIDCVDQRSCGVMQFGTVGMEDVRLFRRVGGPAGMLDSDFLQVGRAVLAQDEYVDTLNLIVHLDENAQGCGGLMACGKLFAGEEIHPAEFESWLSKSISAPDEYWVLHDAMKEARVAYPNAEINTFFSMNSTQRVIPVESFVPGQEVKVFVSEQTWNAWPGQVLPEITAAEIPNEYASARNLIALNEANRANAATIAMELGFGGGQPFLDLEITTLTDWVSATKYRDAFVVTAIPGYETEAVQQLSYAMSHAHLDKTNIRIVGRNIGEVNAMFDALNASPTFTGLTSRGDWAGFVYAEWIEDGLPTSLIMRNSFTPMNRIPRIISGGSGTALVVPAVIDEATVAQALREADVAVPHQPGQLARLVETLRPFANTTVKVLKIGAMAGLTALDVLGYYVIMTEIGEIVFEWGPGIQAPSQTTFPVIYENDPALYESLKQAYVQPDGVTVQHEFPWQISTTLAGLPLDEIWNQAQYQMKVNNITSFGAQITIDDPRLPLVPGITDVVEDDILSPLAFYVEAKSVNEPVRITLFNVVDPQGTQVVFEFAATADTPDWRLVSGDPALLSWPISYPLGVDKQCYMVASVVQSGPDYFLWATPSCAWK